MKKYLVLESFFHERELHERGEVVTFDPKVGAYYVQMERVTDDPARIAEAEKAAKAAAKAKEA